MENKIVFKTSSKHWMGVSKHLTIEYIISRLNTQAYYHGRKCHQFYGKEKWRTLRKTGYYWAEEYATSQLHKQK